MSGHPESHGASHGAEHGGGGGGSGGIAKKITHEVSSVGTKVFSEMSTTIANSVLFLPKSTAESVPSFLCTGETNISTGGHAGHSSHDSHAAAH